MDTLEKFETVWRNQINTTAEALQLFDELEPVELEFMLGRWQGEGFHTNHPMDGLLEALNWYGKEFVDSDCVHPLLFQDSDGNIFKVDLNPAAFKLGMDVPWLQNEAIKPLFSAMTTMLKTEESKARIRMMEYRGKVSATMIYDYLPINDIFRKVDANTVLGLMDYKEISQPFFFVLKRSK